MTPGYDYLFDLDWSTARAFPNRPFNPQSVSPGAIANCLLLQGDVSWSVIPVIDLFAGPGGLGEGFAALLDFDRQRLFRIALSIEMNASARSTLRLRSFFRQFNRTEVPDEYYDVLNGALSVAELYQRFPKQADASDWEAWQAELGKTDSEEVDCRIRVALNGAKEWVLIGGPPCQAYSLVGRSRVINVDREKYERDHRHFLYQEYLRIIATHRPSIFVMENVKGILSSKVKGSLIVERILADLEKPAPSSPSNRKRDGFGYRLYPFADYAGALPLEDLERSPSDFIIQSEFHGIPQARHRFIVLGVRNDLKWAPGKLPNQKKPVTVRQAIGDLPRLRSRISNKGSSAVISEDHSAWSATVREILNQNLDLKTALEPEVERRILAALARLTTASTGGAFIRTKRLPAWQRQWFRDARLQGVCNHEARSHRKDDLWRYLFAACFAQVHGKSPTLHLFPPQLLPEHKNVRDIHEDGVNIDFADRFRVQLKDKPSTTITAHIAKDGHYFIHFDPTQCRSLTVREAARLQTFPDNYLFLGTKTEQYHQVGNAVPPLLAHKLGKIVAEYFI